ncbi:hypothetical protein J4232_00475 [Candidatus Woesearchaeota archaeon]|nr:hypothetical protein [Candidatus Woesearchaeota archaeon]
MITEKKIFIKKIVVFMVILTLIIIILNAVYWKIVIEKKNVYRAEKAYLDVIQQNKTIDYAFFGDSHTRDAVNPAYINSSFNFGTGDENYIKTYYKIKRLLDNNDNNNNNIKIKMLFLEIDPHSFSPVLFDQQRVMSDIWLYSQFIPTNEIKRFTNKTTISIYLESNLPVLGNGEDFAVLLIKNHNMYRGWYNDTRNFSAGNKDKIAEKDIEEHFKETNKFADPIALEYFEKIILLADENKIPITIVRYPLSYEYNKELMKANFSEAEFYSKIIAIMNKHLKEYNKLDYHKIYENNSDYFADSHHLNGAGSIIFTKQLNIDNNIYNKEKAVKISN